MIHLVDDPRHGPHAFRVDADVEIGWLFLAILWFGICAPLGCLMDYAIWWDWQRRPSHDLGTLAEHLVGVAGCFIIFMGFQTGFFLRTVFTNFGVTRVASADGRLRVRRTVLGCPVWPTRHWALARISEAYLALVISHDRSGRHEAHAMGLAYGKRNIPFLREWNMDDQTLRDVVARVSALIAQGRAGG